MHHRLENCRLTWKLLHSWRLIFSLCQSLLNELSKFQTEAFPLDSFFKSTSIFDTMEYIAIHVVPRKQLSICSLKSRSMWFKVFRKRSRKVSWRSIKLLSSDYKKMCCWLFQHTDHIVSLFCRTEEALHSEEALLQDFKPITDSRRVNHKTWLMIKW